MNKILKSLLKLLLIIIILAVIAVPVFTLVFYMKWPVWTGGVIMAGLAGLWFAGAFLRKYFFRKREKQFVRRIVEQDETAIRTAAGSDRGRMNELQKKWKEAVDALRSSHLKSKGNPLYALPWYMIIGESGSGKTSAVKNSRLSSPLTDVSRISGISGTRNCDWWFFDDAIILDTAGRYAIPVDEGRDRDEWEEFLSLLVKYRKKEPLNGLIVTISADKLQSADEGALRDEGQAIRKRIDNLIRATGVKFPVYILITKADLILGMRDFCAMLPEDKLAQAMGSTAKDFDAEWSEIIEHSFEEIVEELRKLRFILMNTDEGAKTGIMMLPEEVENLKSGLMTFAEYVLGENPYSETPMYRGLYFSSALREGEIKSEFLSRYNLTPEDDKGNIEEDYGLFLQEFFSKILPKDRSLFTPVAEFLSWRRVTGSLGFISWLLIWASLCGMLSFSYIKNVNLINELRGSFFQPPALTDNLNDDLVILSRLSDVISEIEDGNSGWIVPHFGLTQTESMAANMKEHFGNLFENAVLKRINKSIEERIKEINRNTDEDTVVELAGFITARIIFMREYLAKDEFTFTDEMNEIAPHVLKMTDARVLDEAAASFGKVYRDYLVWFENKESAGRRLNENIDYLRLLIERKGGDLHWLVRKWVPETGAVSTGQYWGLNSEGVKISGAYTAEGRKNIYAFIEDIRQVIGSKGSFDSRVKAFKSWYTQQYYEQWNSLAEAMPDADTLLENRAERRDMVSLMSTDQNPYIVFIKDADYHLKPLRDESVSVPAWAEEISWLNNIISEAEKIKAEKDGKSIVAKLQEKKESVEEKSVRKVDAAEAKKLALQRSTAEAWFEYVTALSKLAPIGNSRAEAFAMTSKFFPDSADFQSSKSPFYESYLKYRKVASLLNRRGSTPLVDDLILGPLRYQVYYAVMETSCELQSKWEADILGAVEGLATEKIPSALFDKKDGKVWKFINGPADPYIARNKNGYYAKSALGRKIPFTAQFLTYINDGYVGSVVQQDSYEVTISTLPVAVNSGAKIEPYAVYLDLKCAEKKYHLENYNYRTTENIKWNTASCSDAVVTVRFQGFDLKKTYSGQMGFAQFLQDFRSGTKTFTPADFGTEGARLKDFGVETITAAYDIQGAAPIVKLLTSVPSETVGTISICW